jgi:two-component system, sensor histidine kinase and response regulator
MPKNSAPEVLYIEDDPLSARLVCQVVEKAGYKVTHVLSGKDAVSEFAARSFELIISDLNLPDMNGKEIIAKLEEIRKLPPTVVISGTGDEKIIAELLKLGVSDYIPKDMDGGYLILIPSVLEKALHLGELEARNAALTRELELSKESMQTILSERERSDNDLLLRTQELEDSNNEMDAFSHTVAHDLKNPLNSILGLSGLLRERIELSEKETNDSLKFIEQSATNMNTIIDSLMVLAGVRKQEMEPMLVNMSELIEVTLGRLTFFKHEMDAEIIVGELPNAEGHAPWIQEVWVNYITNAIKYGGSPPVVTIGGEVLSDGTLKYWVQDNGPGFSEEDQSKLFVPFSRLWQVSVKGYGLGLSIVLRIAEGLGGEVGVESQLGTGSRFWFTLPSNPV